MQLKNYIKTLNKDEDVYIGSSSGYLFIGKPDEFIERCDELDYRILESKNYCLVTAEKRITSIQKPKFKYTKTGQDEISRYNKKIEKLDKYIKQTKSYINNYIDLADRNVLKSYVRDRLYPKEGRVIIIDGKETGWYWNKEEYLKNRLKTKDIDAKDIEELERVV